MPFIYQVIPPNLFPSDLVLFHLQLFPNFERSEITLLFYCSALQINLKKKYIKSALLFYFLREVLDFYYSTVVWNNLEIHKKVWDTFP